MRRLYLHVYLAFLGIVLLFGCFSSIAWLLAHPREEQRRMFEGVGEIVAEILPPADRPLSELQRAVEGLGEKLSLRLTVRGDDGALLASVGDPLPAPRQRESGWMRGGGPAWALRLPDGRWLVASEVSRHGAYGWIVMLGLAAAAIGIGAYPVARRLTRRLERLQTRVDQLGAGNLGARVDIEGKDEVAQLARSFNQAADRIERLVNAQRSMLASASHELRSPLARMRVAIELIARDDRNELRDQIARDIAELDELIGEILLASRLDALEELDRTDEVDFLALVAEEAARVDAQVSGNPVRIQGSGRMLRRLVRNLFENARRHAEGTPIDAEVTPLNGGARLRVLDRGPGVPSEERERIFEPFYRPPGMRESSEGGVGLGLALVRRISRHHGGDARCLARDGGGTCFEVKLSAS
jgi:signal transduction histidine kinase